MNLSSLVSRPHHPRMAAKQRRVETRRVDTPTTMGRAVATDPMPSANLLRLA